MPPLWHVNQRILSFILDACYWIISIFLHTISLNSNSYSSPTSPSMTWFFQTPRLQHTFVLGNWSWQNLKWITLSKTYTNTNYDSMTSSPCLRDFIKTFEFNFILPFIICFAPMGPKRVGGDLRNLLTKTKLSFF